MRNLIIILVMFVLGTKLTQAQNFVTLEVVTGRGTITTDDTSFLIPSLDGQDSLRSVNPNNGNIDTTNIVDIADATLHTATIMQRSNGDLMVRTEEASTWSFIGNFGINGSDILKVGQYYYLCAGSNKLRVMDSVTGSYGDTLFSIGAPNDWFIYGLATDGTYIYVSGKNNASGSVFGRYHVVDETFEELLVIDLPADSGDTTYMSSRFFGIVFLDNTIFLYKFVTKQINSDIFINTKIIEFDESNSNYETIFEFEKLLDEDGFSTFQDFAGLYLDNKLYFALISQS